jgi:hypothetical protein
MSSELPEAGDPFTIDSRPFLIRRGWLQASPLSAGRLVQAVHRVPFAYV